MKLDVNVLRYMTKEEFRVLTAVEMGQKNVRSFFFVYHSVRSRQRILENSVIIGASAFEVVLRCKQVASSWPIRLRTDCIVGATQLATSSTHHQRVLLCA